MRERLPWWVRTLVVLRGRGPDRNGFWGSADRGVSRRTMVISGEWWVATRWWWGPEPNDGLAHLEPSKDMSLP